MNSDVNRDRKPGSRYSIWWVVAFSTVALGLGLTGALTRPVWHDELYTLWLARMPLMDLVSALTVDSGPPLHYILCHVLYTIVGWPEGSALGTLMVRLPSVAAFSILPWVLWHWARDRSEMFCWASALTMTWLPMLYFATEARAYALLALVNAVLWLLGPELVSKGGSRLVLFAGLAAALPMLHYAGLVSFCLLPSMMIVLPRPLWRRCLLALGGAALPVVLWLPVILGAPGDSMAWVDISNGPGRPGMSSLEVLSPAGPFPALFEVPPSSVPPMISLIALVALTIGALVGLRRREAIERDRGERRARVAWLGAGMLPVAILGGLAILGVPVYFAGRTESMVWPIAVALFAAGIVALPRPARWAVASPYVALALMTVVVWVAVLSAAPAAPGIRVGRHIADELMPGDVVVVVGLWQLEVRHGLMESSAGLPDVVVTTLPRLQSEHPGWFDVESAKAPGLINEARDVSASVAARDSRLWLVWSPTLPVEENVMPAFAGWRRVSPLRSQMVAVDLLMPPEGSS